MVRNKISEYVMSSLSVSNYKAETMRRVLQRLEDLGILFSVCVHETHTTIDSYKSYIGLIWGLVDCSLAKITPVDNEVVVSTASSADGIGRLWGLSSGAMLLPFVSLQNFFM